MIASQAGDAAAYEKLLIELLPRARRQVGARVRDAAAREDIVQNALMSTHRARHTYRPERPFTPWFNTIVRNATIDWARSRARQSQRELPLDLERTPEPAAVETSASAGTEIRCPRSSRTPLRNCLRRRRQAVELIHLEGHSVVEAASRAGVSTGALKVRAHRGYRALRALPPKAGRLTMQIGKDRQAAEDHVRALVLDLKPVHRIPRLRVGLAAAAGIWLGMLVVLWLLGRHATRPAGHSDWSDPAFLSVVLGLALLALGSTIAALASAVPGRDRATRIGLGVGVLGILVALASDRLWISLGDLALSRAEISACLGCLSHATAIGILLRR